MERKGVAPEKIEKIIQSISSFALTDFPNARDQFRHSRLRQRVFKVHRAPEFYASLLNNQPMGFYTRRRL